MNFTQWLAIAKADLPGLTPANCTPTSPVDGGYNCIAWAAEDTQRWWWPDPMQQAYWPNGIPRVNTLEAFVAAYGALGYVEKTDPSLEPGKQKVAIFAGPARNPLHASRQLPDGLWTSKLGPDIDIRHELTAVEGPTYGTVAVVLARVVLADSITML